MKCLPNGEAYEPYTMPLQCASDDFSPSGNTIGSTKTLGLPFGGLEMKLIIFLFASATIASAADIVIGSQGSQSSDPWCGS